MARFKRIALGLLVAYAASMTWFASRKSAEVLLYRKLYGLAPLLDPFQKDPNHPLLMTARDYGLDLTLLEFWALRIGDIQGRLLEPAIVVFFGIGLGAALIPSHQRKKF